MRQIITYIMFYIFFVTAIKAQWSTNFKNNLQITDWSRLPLSAASDGKGGVFIAIDRDVYDTTNAISYSYLFRIDKFGYQKWNRPIHLGKRDWQDKVVLIEDGSGGVIAGIRDLEVIQPGIFMLLDYKIRVQRIDSSGNKLWGDGVLVSTDTTQQFDFNICTDGNGGCYVSWLSEKTMDYIYSDGYRAIQHISATGERMWSDTGKVLYTGGVQQYHHYWHQIKPNYTGGIYTINTTDLNNFYYLNLDSSGNVIWETPARFNSTPSHFKPFLENIYSTKYGELLTFASKWDSSSTYLIYEMDKINNNGEYSWDNKKVFADSVGERTKIISLYENRDSSFSVYWMNMDGKGNYSSYYQKILINGKRLFNGYGISPCSEFPNQNWGDKMIKSNLDYIIIFIDYNGLRAKKISQNGLEIWSDDVIFSILGATDRRYVTDKHGGFIYVFIKDLNGLWAQQVSSNGNLGEVITNVDVKDNIILQDFELFQNYPNPFNPATKINYFLKQSGFVRLKVYDLLGKEIAVLVNEEKTQGSYSVKFNGSNLPSGVYFYTLQVNNFMQSRKMILLR